MAMITFEDLPSTNTPINAANLNNNFSEIINVLYPVGSYYETSDTSFNPNTAWGGTWVEDSKGRVTVGQDTTQSEFDVISETGGSKSVTLTSQELPTLYALAPTSTSGGSIAYFSNSAIGGFNGSGAGTPIATINGGGQAHNNLQPYVVVKRWHRTA